MRTSGQLIILTFVAVSFVVGCSDNVGNAIANSNRLNTNELMTAAAAGHKAGRIEDAGFLFLAAQGGIKSTNKYSRPSHKGATVRAC